MIECLHTLRWHMSTNSLEKYFLDATESAAIAAASWIGLGDGKAADGAAVEAMRNIFDHVPFDGRVAIGEGERDDAPMLWIGEPLGIYARRIRCTVNRHSRRPVGMYKSCCIRFT